MKEKDFLSLAELAKILGVSRISVYKKVKKGEIPATRVGRSFVVAKSDLGGVLRETLGKEEKRQVEQAVKKTVREYGETLRLLGNE